VRSFVSRRLPFHDRTRCLGDDASLLNLNTSLRCRDRLDANESLLDRGLLRPLRRDRRGRREDPDFGVLVVGPGDSPVIYDLGEKGQKSSL